MPLAIYRFCQQNKRISDIILISLILFFFRTSSALPIEGPEINNKVKVVIIDPGHGGKDPGAVGKTYKEKDIVLAVALKLGEYIEKNYKDVKVIYTRKDDTFIPLDERSAIANRNKADLFISIHANANSKTHIIGAETFVMGTQRSSSNLEVAKRENSVITLEEDYSTKYEGFDPENPESNIIFNLLQYTHLEQSLNFATLVQNEFREKAKRYDRGVKQDVFMVLWQTTMPSVLIELGFISHVEEEKYMASKQGQDYLASAIYRAFKEYKTAIESSSNFEVMNQNIESKEDLPTDKMYFKVQLFSTQNRLSLEDNIFKGFVFPEVFAADNWHKYAIGRFKSYEEASEFCNSIQMKFDGAFVIAVSDGQIIPVNEAISGLRSNNR